MVDYDDKDNVPQAAPLIDTLTNIISQRTSPSISLIQDLHFIRQCVTHFEERLANKVSLPPKHDPNPQCRQQASSGFEWQAQNSGANHPY